MEETWVSRYLDKVIGTFVLVLFGCTAVIIAVLFGQASVLFSARLAWGFAVALAIFVAGSLSGAHLNPAVALGFAVSGRHPSLPGSKDRPRRGPDNGGVAVARAA